MDFLKSDIWKTTLIQDWLAILVVWIILFIGSVCGGSMLIRRWRRIAKSKSAALQFETYERGTFWTKALLGLEEVIQLRGVWWVTNVSFRQVSLTHFRLLGMTTEHHLLAVRGSDSSEHLLLPGVKYDVEINCVIRQAKGLNPDRFAPMCVSKIVTEKNTGWEGCPLCTVHLPRQANNEL